MTTALMPTPKQQYFLAAGVPMVAGKIYTFAAGTSTPKQTFTDAAGSIPQANPIILNARGEPASAIFWSGNYKVEIRDALNNLIYTVDNYNSDPFNIAASITASSTAILALFSASSGAALVGYLPPDGKPNPVTVASRLALLDGVSPVVSVSDANTAASVNSLRDTTSLAGGTPGFVNAGVWHKTIAGAANTSFEWGIVGIIDNFATTGENVAIYGQGNKRAVGPTWAGVFEARDFTHVANPTKGLVGIEVDTFGNGTDGNGVRIGIDISIGRDDAAGAIMETGFGVRVGALNSSLAEGRVIRAFATGVITFDCAFDSALGTQSAGGVAFRMAVGQKLSFSATNDRTMFYSGGVLAYQVAGITQTSTSDTGVTDQIGAMRILGTQVITSRRTGYTNAMTGTADRANAYDTATISLIQLAQRVKAIEDDLLTHGLIGA